MRHIKPLCVAACIIGLTQAGYGQWNLTKPACKQAIDDYYSTRPECLLKTPNPHHPELGKLCFGYRTVVVIDSFTQPWNGMPRTSRATYHYTITRVPAWARSQEVLTAHPEIRTALRGTHQASDNLVGGKSEHNDYVWGVIPPGTFVE